LFALKTFACCVSANPAKFDFHFMYTFMYAREKAAANFLPAECFMSTRRSFGTHRNPFFRLQK
jgi:hypothetical protein